MAPFRHPQLHGITTLIHTILLVPLCLYPANYANAADIKSAPNIVPIVSES